MSTPIIGREGLLRLALRGDSDSCPADDAVAGQAVAAYRVADDGVGPYREVLAGGEECRSLTAGEHHAHDGAHPRSRRRLLVKGDHRREVLAVTRLDNASDARSVAVAGCGSTRSAH